MTVGSFRAKKAFNLVVVSYSCEAVSLAELYCCVLGFFFTIQRIRIVLGRCLFLKISSHIIMIFEVKLE